MSAHAAIHARAMGDYIGGDPLPKSRSPTEYDTCECGERKRTEAELCHACSVARRRAVQREVDVPLMLERHKRFEFALEVGYTVQELMDRARRDDLPTCAQMLHERPCEYMRVWCEREGIAVGEREVA